MAIIHKRNEPNLATGQRVRIFLRIVLPKYGNVRFSPKNVVNLEHFFQIIIIINPGFILVDAERNFAPRKKKHG
jgi:hypothetical protein